MAGNSCCSQMAEAIVNTRLGEDCQAFSRYLPGRVRPPQAIAALAEIGILHKGESKLANEYKSMALARVVTICDEAKETCPNWLGKGIRVHKCFSNPAIMDKLADFRKV